MDKGTLGSHMTSNSYVPPNQMPIPQDSKEIEKAREELEDLKKNILKKFPFTISLSILPAQTFQIFEEDEGFTKEEIEKKHLHMLMLIPEDEYKNIQKKIKPEVLQLVKGIKQKIWIHIKTPVDLWNYGSDSKFEFVDAIAASFPLHDTGLLGAMRVANIHKTLVLRKFEKYVASYVVGGSLVRGTADKDSDVDTFVVIDDTDVKKMPRLQLKEKLRGFIYDYIREASALAGVKNILNVQVYLLTEFWESVKDANPVIFTFIRDGVPMYDRGTFLPWKLLLKMGKIKPSPEAIDLYMKEGERTEEIVKRRLMDAMVDAYYGVVTPTQALMMLAGHAPPVPKTIVSEVKKVFVDEEKIMTMRELKILEKAVKYFKDYEHGTLKSISGKEVDSLIKDGKEYDVKLKEMRKKIEKRAVINTANNLHEEVFTLLKNLFGTHPKEALVKKFNSELVKKGKVSARFVPMVKAIEDIKVKAKSPKFNQNDMDGIRRDAVELINALTEYVQRKEIMIMEQNVINLTHDGKKSQIVFTKTGVFMIDGASIKKYSHGKFHKVENAEFDEALGHTKEVVKTKVDTEMLEALKKEFGNFEISM